MSSDCSEEGSTDDAQTNTPVERVQDMPPAALGSRSAAFRAVLPQEGGLALVAIVIAFVALWPLSNVWPRVTIWVAALLLVVSFFAVAGQSLTGLWRGALIDGRNLLSLSRFQLILWTAVGLSSYLTAVLTNLAHGAADPLAVAVPEELWILMGITTTSLVGSPLLLRARAANQGNPAAVAMQRLTPQAAAKFDERLVPGGPVLATSDPKKSSWADLFCGEEEGNAGRLDVAKVQMFFFTIVLVLTYSVGLANLFGGAASLVAELPAFSEGALALLGISHAGYLASKATPHT